MQTKTKGFNAQHVADAILSACSGLYGDAVYGTGDMTYRQMNAVMNHLEEDDVRVLVSYYETEEDRVADIVTFCVMGSRVRVPVTD